MVECALIIAGLNYVAAEHYPVVQCTLVVAEYRTVVESVAGLEMNAQYCTVVEGTLVVAGLVYVVRNQWGTLLSF